MQVKKQIKLDNSLQILFKTSIFIFIMLIFSKILAYVYRIIIARHFGPEIYGLFSLALIIVSWFMVISLLGLSEGVLRFIAFYRGKKQIKKIRYIFRVSSLILFFTSVIAGIISFFSADFIALNFFHNENLIIFLKIFSFMIPFWAFFNLFFSVMNAFEKIRATFFYNYIIQNSLKVSILLIFVLLGLGIYSIIFSTFIVIFIIFLLSYIYCKYRLSEIFVKSYLAKKVKHKIFNSFFSYSWPLMFVRIISTIFYSIDSFTLGFFKTATEVGFYNAAVPITMLLAMTPELFLQLLFPIITKEYAQKNFLLIKELSKQIAKWIFILNVPAFILFITFPGAIINFLFGQQYLVASTALRFLLIGSLFSSLFIISNNLISMIGKSKLILIDMVIACIINIILNILLVPSPFVFGLDNSLGINGAAIATMISVIIFNLILMVQANYYTSIIPLRRKMLKIVLIAIISLFPILYFKKIVTINLLSIIILAGIFFSLYIILLIVFKAFDKNDLMIFHSIKRKINSFKK